MLLCDLIAQLTELAEEYGDEIEVRYAQQPSYPLEYEIGGVQVVNLAQADPEQLDGGEDEFVAYVFEGCQRGYLPGVVRNELEW